VADTFFGIQVALKNFHRDPLRRRLHDLIAEEDATRVGVHAKQRFWKRFSALVNEAMPVFELGDWEFVRGRKAKTMFDEWSSEIEGSLATEAEELGDAADEVNRLSGEAQYILVTMMVLADGGSNADATLGEWCDVPEKYWHTRTTFARLIGVFSRLNFANIQADAVYLMPGHDRDGLSFEDLRAPGYEYLQPLA
jgi:hypothetical protein